MSYNKHYDFWLRPGRLPAGVTLPKFQEMAMSTAPETRSTTRGGRDVAGLQGYNNSGRLSITSALPPALTAYEDDMASGIAKLYPRSREETKLFVSFDAPPPPLVAFIEDRSTRWVPIDAFISDECCQENAEKVPHKTRQVPRHVTPCHATPH